MAIQSIFCHPESNEGSPLTIERGDPSHSFRVTTNQHRHHWVAQ